jgi:aspartate racemase
VRARHPVVGIIGGMGPEATVELMRRVIARTPAYGDEDHIHLIVESNPKIPSRMAHLIERTGSDPTPELVRIARNLQRAGADVLAMPCNTAHGYLPAIQAAVSIPMLDMVELTVTRLANLRPNARVGLLASSALIKAGVYAKPLAAHGLEPVLPQRQEELMDLIKGVKRGSAGTEAGLELADLSRELSGRTDVLLIACTELSLISAPLETSLEGAIPLIDSIDVLTQAIVDFAAAPPPGQTRPL